MTTATSAHIVLLRSQLHERQVRNARYSLRAFAHFLEIHPSALSRILAGKQELSTGSCEIILAKLNLSSDLERTFINSVVIQKASRLAERLNAASFHHSPPPSMPELPLSHDDTAPSHH